MLRFEYVEIVKYVKKHQMNIGKIMLFSEVQVFQYYLNLCFCEKNKNNNNKDDFCF